VSAPGEIPAPREFTESERTAFRMGVLAAGAVYADAVDECCRERAQNLRIAIAGRLVDCDAPAFWPDRGEAEPTHGSSMTTHHEERKR
jgi:hypothetical protein